MTPSPARYRFLVLFGPAAPAARPAGGEPALPEVVVRLAEASPSHFWMETFADPKRQVLRLEVRGGRPGWAVVADGGAEADLRTHHAAGRGKAVEAYLLDGSPDDLPDALVTGRGSGFHVSFRRSPGGELGDRVYAVRREEDPTRFARRYLVRPPPEPGAGPMADRVHTFLPGVVRVEATAAELAAALDHFLLASDGSLPAEDDPSPDYLFTTPLAAGDESFLSPAWRAVAAALIDPFTGQHQDPADWPPLLRLIVACRQPALASLLAEGATVTPHPFDPDGRPPAVRADWGQPPAAYRRWVLDAAQTPTGNWKSNVLGHQRDDLAAALTAVGWGWPTFRSAPPAAGPPPADRFRGRHPSPPPAADAGLDAWADWLARVPVEEQRVGLGTAVAVVDALRVATADGRLPPEAASAVGVRLTDCSGRWDRPGVWYFDHDRFVDYLGGDLFPPVAGAVCELPFVDRPVFPRAVVYYLLAVLTSPAVDDWLSPQAAVWAALTQALGEQPDRLVQADLTVVRLPTSGTAAALARLLVPRGRLRPSGFTLGRSRLLHPNALLGGPP